MSHGPGYTDFHPRWFRQHVSTYWWLERKSYVAFIVRELSSVFVAWSIVYLLFLVRAVSLGQAAYQQLLSWSARPLVLALNIVALSFLLFHAVTWFNLAPKAIVARVRGRRVPGYLIAGSNYFVWALLSALIAALLLGG